MYVCDKHGALESEWCNDCGKIIKCDCSDVTGHKVESEIPYQKQSRSISVNVNMCPTCGDVKDVGLW